MNFKGEYIKLGELDIISFKEKVLLFDKEWHASTWRQERFDTHKFTQSIELVFDRDFRHADPTFLDMYYRYENDLSNIFMHIGDCFTRYSYDHGLKDDGYVIRALLVNLLPGGSIPEHIDGGFSLTHCHRIHVPIISSDSSLFTVGGITRNMKEGEIWEINNKKLHSVTNDGDNQRVHLIIDWVIPDERCCCGMRARPDGVCSPRLCEATDVPRLCSCLN